MNQIIYLHPLRHPRKLKKAIKRWLVEPDYQLRGRLRRRFLRWISRERMAQGMGPLRRLPGGRVSLLDLW